MSNHKLWSTEEDGQLPRWLNEDERSRCYCDDRGWVLVHLDGNEEVIVASNTLNNPSEKGHGFDEQGKSHDPDRNGNGNITYTLGKSTSSVNEGSSISFQLTTTYVADGTQVPYTIEGIEPEDLDSGELSGNFLVNSDNSFINISIKEDSLAEGPQTLVLRLSTGESISVDINDTSLPVPTYTLSSNPTNSVNEGQSLTITLTTEHVDDGEIDYQITGISEDDLVVGSDSLVGCFYISNNTDSIVLHLSEDVSFQEGDETLTLSLDNGQASINITVNDSSTATPVYNLSAPASISEGQDLTINLATQYVSSGTVVNYTLSGTADLANDFDSVISNTGQFVVGSSESVTLSLKDDLSFNEGNETLVLSLQDSLGSISVDIVDSSTATPVYNLSAPASISEGGSLSINLSTQYVNDGPVGYQISGIDAADLNAGSDSLTGNFDISGGSDSLTLNLKEDISFNEGNETLVLTLDGGLGSISVNVVDSSTASPSYSLSTLGDVTFVNEGDSLTISLSTQYVSSGTAIPYTLGGSVDLANDFDSAISGTGQFVVGSSESITFNLKDDLSFEEGDETLTLSLDGLNTQISVIVKDTSKATEVYTLSAPASINEGETLSISLNTQYVSSGAVVNYTLGGSVDLANDFDSTISSTGQFVIGTTETLNLTLDSDLSFNEGDETLSLTLQDGLGSVSVNVIDTSVATPTYTLTAPGSINEGQDLVISLTTQFVNDGPVAYTVTGIDAADLDIAGGSAELTGNINISSNTGSITLKIKSDISFNEGSETLTLTLDNGEDAINVTVNDSSTATPVYTLSAPASVNEGQDLVISLTTQFVNDGSVAYTITGIQNADLDIAGGSAGLSGNFSLSGGADSITLKLREDLTNGEGDETLVLSLNNGEDSISVTVADTSKAPVYTLTSSPQTSVNEGTTLRINLETENVSTNTVAYTVSGITAPDLDAASSNLQGDFVLDSNGNGFVEFHISEDSLTEDSPEDVLVLTLTGLGEQISININDTSKTPIWSMSFTPQSPVDEGVDLVVTLQTQNVPDGDYPYTISGVGFDSDDLDIAGGSAGLTGNFTVSGNPSQGSITLKIANDNSTGEDVETITVALTNGNASIDVDISDTSSSEPIAGPVIGATNSVHPAISDDGIYSVTSGGANDANYLKFYKYENSVWNLTQSLTSAGGLTGYGDRSLSDDGSVFAYVEPYPNSGSGITKVFVRGLDGQYTERDSFIPGGSGFQYPWGITLSGDGQTMVIGAWTGNKLRTYEYTNNSWNLVDTVGTSHKVMQIDMSSDGQMLVAATGWAQSTNIGFYVFERSGQSWVQQSVVYVSNRTVADKMTGVALSKGKNLVAVGTMGYHTSPSEIYFFDYNSSSDSWTQRASTVTDPDTTLTNWFNDGSQIALSEETNGQITLITTNGKTYSLPVNPPTP